MAYRSFQESPIGTCRCNCSQSIYYHDDHSLIISKCLLGHVLPHQNYSEYYYLHSLGLRIYLLSPLRLRIYLSHHFVIDAANVLCKFAGTFVSVA